jgi:serine/threonine protein kinase
LYSRGEKVWKLTDFGISGEGTSQRGVRTVFSRGTASYRAPELLRKESTFTNKVDIWALGCVLHDLAYGKVMFSDDWAVVQFAHDTLELQMPYWPGFLGHQLQQNILHMLERGSKERPRSSELLKIFGSYCSLVKVLLRAGSQYCGILYQNTYPKYGDLRRLVLEESAEDDVDFDYAEVSDERGTIDIYYGRKQMKRKLDGESAPKLSWSLDGSLTFWQGEMFLEKGDYNGAISEYRKVIDKNPTSFWAWQHLFRSYLARDGADMAVLTFGGLYSSAASLPFYLHLSLLNAAVGQFGTAIRIYNGADEDYMLLNEWTDLVNDMLGSKYKSPLPEDASLRALLNQ